MTVPPYIQRISPVDDEVMYAIDCGGCYTLVDAGSEVELEGKLQALRALGISLDSIAAMLITHFHIDHCDPVALAKWRELTPAKVVTHRYTVEPVTEIPEFFVKWRTELPAIDRALVDYLVEDGDTLQIGNRTFLAHHLPGHTHDSVAYQLDGDFFVGDIASEYGIGWVDIHWGSCIPQYRESLQRLFDLRPALIYPGHGEPCRFTRGMMYRPMKDLDQAGLAMTPIAMAKPTPMRPAEEPRRTIRIA